MSLIRKAFKRLHYPIDIIAQCVRWYLAYSLSLRNLEEMMAERGIDVDHSTLHRWVIRLIPLVNKVFRRYKRPVGRCWRVDETYIKIKGQWKYLYRAVDKTGQTIDFLLTAKRDTATALRFFCKTIRHHDEPEIVTIDKSSANKAALDTLNMGKIPEGEAIEIRQNKYLNNLIKQDHRNIKRRIRTMPGFKSFRRAQTLLAGIEIVSMLRKGLKVVSLDLPTSYQFMNRTDEFTERMLAALNSMMLDMLAAVARKDYEDRHRRQVQGVQKAKEEGKYKGRPINKILHQKLKAF